MRREFPARVKVAAFERAGKHCEVCTAPLYPGKFHYDHITPDALGGEPTLENCRVVCTACHSVKTGRQDVPAIAKADRQRARHVGARPKPQRSPWKRKVNGETVRRDG